MKNLSATLFVFFKKLFRPGLWGLVASALLLGACAAPAGPAKATEIKIVVLPIIDALPFYVAAKQGYYTANGITVTFIPAASAAERDQLISAGQADGMINDLVSVALYNKQEVQVQTVRYALTASSSAAMFSILSAKDSGVTSAAGLAGVPIGM